MSEHEANERSRYVKIHLLCGWWGLLLFATLGFALEAMLGLRIEFYLSLDNEARRLVWRLAHAHGTLLSLIQIAMAATISLAIPSVSRRLRIASRCLLAATILLPGGFFAAGFGLQGDDPGLGIFLAPAGAALLLLALLLTAIELLSASSAPLR